MPRRNAGPTPPSPPAQLNHPRTINPNAYESASDIVARRNAENAQRNQLRGMGGRDMTQYSAGNFAPQMPQLPRQGMQGLNPQAQNQVQTPFHYYPDFGSEQHMMSQQLEQMYPDENGMLNRDMRKRPFSMTPQMPPRQRMLPQIPFGGASEYPYPPMQGGVPRGRGFADMTPEEIQEMYMMLSKGGAFRGDGTDSIF